MRANTDNYKELGDKTQGVLVGQYLLGLIMIITRN